MNSVAKELLGVAKKRLEKFYRPAPAHAPASTVQISSHRAGGKAEPPPPPPGAYAAKAAESKGVIVTIDALAHDLDLKMLEGDQEEQKSQEDYEEFTKHSAEKRQLDAATLQSKGGGQTPKRARGTGRR